MSAQEIKKMILRSRIVRELSKIQSLDKRQVLISVIDKLIQTGIMLGNEHLIADIFEELGYSKEMVLALIMSRKLLHQNDRHKRNKALVVDKDWKVDEDVPLAPSIDLEQDGM